MLESYAALVVVPLLCAPVQLLWLKSGRRYDVGMAMTVATMTFLVAAAMRAAPADHIKLVHIAGVLLAISIPLVLLRVLAAAYGTPMQFTLLSLAQMWATMPLVHLALKQQQAEEGIAVTQAVDGRLVFAAALIASWLLAWRLSAAKLPERLLAFTESPSEYGASMGSPLILVAKIELLTLACCAAAGTAMRLVHGDLSAELFTDLGLWMVLSVAPLPGFRWLWAGLGPLVVVLVRLLVKTYLPASTSSLFAYLALAVVLLSSAAVEMGHLRVRRTH